MVCAEECNGLRGITAVRDPARSQSILNSRRAGEGRGPATPLSSAFADENYVQDDTALSLKVFLAESSQRASFGLSGFFFTVFRRGRGFERIEKPPGDHRDFLDGGLERGFIGLGWFCKSADLPDELESRGADFVVGGGRCEVE